MIARGRTAQPKGTLNGLAVISRHRHLFSASQRSTELLYFLPFLIPSSFNIILSDTVTRRTTTDRVVPGPRLGGATAARRGCPSSCVLRSCPTFGDRGVRGGQLGCERGPSFSCGHTFFFFLLYTLLSTSSYSSPGSQGPVSVIGKPGAMGIHISMSTRGGERHQLWRGGGLVCH
jgi:hypothetical protein